MRIFVYAPQTARRYPLQKTLELVQDRIFSAISRAHFVDLSIADLETMPETPREIRYRLREHLPDQIWIVGRKEAAERGLQLRDYFQPYDRRLPAILSVPHPGPTGPFWGKPENAQAWVRFVRAQST